MKKGTLFSLIMVLFCGFAQAVPLNLNEISEASCKVNAGGGCGSGICIAFKDDSYFVLTNGHVVGQNKQVYVEFFKLGKKTTKISGQVVWRAYQQRTPVDFAVIKVSAAKFGQYPPRVIPLVPEGYQIKNGAYICSAGCPKAMWLSAWEGYVKTNENSQIVFTPPPLEGQSGSGMCVLVRENGELNTRVGGVITWKSGEYRMDSNGFPITYGGAVLASTLYRVTKGQTSNFGNIPSDFQEIAISDLCDRCNKPPSKHALGNNGQYYCCQFDRQGKFIGCIMPEGVKVDKYPVGIFPFCDPNRNGPGGDYGNNPYIPGQPNPNDSHRNYGNPNPSNPSNPNNPYGSLPNIDAPWLPSNPSNPNNPVQPQPTQPTQPTPQLPPSQIKPLVPITPNKPPPYIKPIEVPIPDENPLTPVVPVVPPDSPSEKEVELQKEVDKLTSQIIDLETKVNSLTTANGSLDGAKKIAEETLAKKQEELTAKAEELKKTQTVVTTTTANLEESQKEVLFNLGKAEKAQSLIGRLKLQRNIGGTAGGGIALGLLSWLGTLWYKKRGKEKLDKIHDQVHKLVEQRLEGLKDRLPDTGDKIIDVAQSKLDSLHNRIDDLYKDKTNIVPVNPQNEQATDHVMSGTNIYNTITSGENQSVQPTENTENSKKKDQT